ncbi:Rrp15p-domain-containing protein [Pyronema omphalodes]|nr:Rrp15p-domain-containing protein [Pyronema omphalodes]
MPPQRAQKKRKTAPTPMEEDVSPTIDCTAAETTETTEKTPTTTTAAADKKTTDDDSTKDNKPSPSPPEDSHSDADDKYDSAESDSEISGDEAEVDEYDLDVDSGAESDDSISSLLESQATLNKKKRKRNDPDSFSNSMSKILSSHLTKTARKDPVLVRAKQTKEHADDGKLEAKAKRVLKEELRREKEKGRVRDLVPQGDDQAAGKALERERVLRSIARSGVAKLYNAVRAAQIKAEEASREVKEMGLVGMGNREAKVTEMSKQGFLDLIQSSAK